MAPNSQHSVTDNMIQCHNEPEHVSPARRVNTLTPDSMPRSTFESRNSVRSLILEQAYVHDVYSKIARERGACSPIRSHIKDFLCREFEVGSLILDVGCGDGKYITINPSIIAFGMEHCEDWFKSSRNSPTISCANLLLGDAIQMPFRDQIFDGLLCCGVLHHMSSKERRIKAINEMSRVLAPGGKILISAWSFEGRELTNQDVLIKWDGKVNHGRDSRMSWQSGSETTGGSSGSSSSFSTTSTTYVNRRAAYESCNTPTIDHPECDINASPQSNQMGQKQAFSNRKRQLVRHTPISVEKHELREHESPSRIISSSCSGVEKRTDTSSEQSVNEAEKSTNENTRRPSLKEQCSGLVSMIRESLLTRTSRPPLEKQGKVTVSSVVGKFLQHLSNNLTISSRQEIEVNTTADQQPDQKVIGVSSSQESGDEIGLESPGLREDPEGKDEVKSLHGTNGSKKRLFGRLFKKSLSSDSIDSKKSRQQSINTESGTFTTTNTITSYNTSTATTSSSGSRLVAYYSMPELRSIHLQTEEPFGIPDTRLWRKGAKIDELHPITFMDVEEISLPKMEVKRDSSQDTEAAVDELECLFPAADPPPNLPEPTYVKPHKSPLHLDVIEPCLLPVDSYGYSSTSDEDEEKKTQRSCSVEYKAKISPSHKQKWRRFSVSPSYLVPKTLVRFFQEENMHETHPSVGSEESFITIIPAQRSCRDSVDIVNDDDASDGLDEVMDEKEFSEEDDEVARVESLPDEENDVSTKGFLLDVPTRSETRASEFSSNKSNESFLSNSRDSETLMTPVPSTELYRYFHLFRSGDLEELILENVPNLRIIRSYYSEHATSWCIVCEKKKH